VQEVGHHCSARVRLSVRVRSVLVGLRCSFVKSTHESSVPNNFAASLKPARRSLQIKFDCDS
jgi:hypothetical protein